MLQLLQLLGPYVVWLYPIGIVILIIYLRGWLVASRDLRASLFTLERETATQRMRRSATGVFSVFGALVLLFFGQFFLSRTFDLSEYIRPTPTPGFGTPVVTAGPSPTAGTPEPTVTADPRTPSPTPSPTPTRRPTLQWATSTPVVTVTPVPAAPANCPTAGVQITQPGVGAIVSGRVDIRGTASIANFNFYKIEIGLGDHPARWTSISDVHRNAVTNGLLDVLDTSTLPAGTYSIRLVVVDLTGNWPPPCEVQIVVTH